MPRIELETEKAELLSQEEFEAWIFQGLKKPRCSRENIFQEGAQMHGAYDRWVDGGAIDRMEEQEFEQIKAKRLDEIYPTGRYVRHSEWSLDSIHGHKSLVAQYGRSNRYIPLDELLTRAGLHKYEVTVYSGDESGSGYSSSRVTLRVRMEPGDKSRKIYATDLIKKNPLGSYG